MIFICTLPQHCRHRIFTKFVEQLKTHSQGFPLWPHGLRAWLVSMRMRVWSRTSLSGLRIWCFRELGYRSKMQLTSWVAALLWCKLAPAAPIQPLTWELPYATGGALRSKTKQNKKNTHKRTYSHPPFLYLWRSTILVLVFIYSSYVFVYGLPHMCIMIFICFVTSGKCRHYVYLLFKITKELRRNSGL